MGRPLTTQAQIIRHLLHAKVDPVTLKPAAFLLLVEVPLRGDEGVIRLVNNKRPVKAGGKVFQPCQVRVDWPEESLEGVLGQMTVTIANVSRIVMSLVDRGDYGIAGGEGPGPLLGQIVTARLALSTELDELSDALAIRQRISEVTVNAKQATFVCGDPSKSIQVPGGVWDRRTAPQLLPSAGAEVGQ